MFCCSHSCPRVFPNACSSNLEGQDWPDWLIDYCKWFKHPHEKHLTWGSGTNVLAASSSINAFRGSLVPHMQSQLRQQHFECVGAGVG